MAFAFSILVVVEGEATQCAEDLVDAYVNPNLYLISRNRSLYNLHSLNFSMKENQSNTKYAQGDLNFRCRTSNIARVSSASKELPSLD